MNIRTLLPAIAVALIVYGNGFERIVTQTTQGDSCELDYTTSGMYVMCPDGSRGTLLFYTNDADEAPACQVDFWHAADRWHAASGKCTLQWRDATTLNVSAASANSAS
jgi:hypothetical protein